MTIPGMKWWTWRSRTLTLRNGPSVPRRRIDHVESRATTNVSAERRQQVEKRVLTGSTGPVAGRDDVHRFTQGLGRLLLRVPRAQATPLFHDRHGAKFSPRPPTPGPRFQPHARRADASAAPEDHCSSNCSSGTSRTTRAGTPITTARAGTSCVTTAPAATNASSPISTPGQEHRAAADRGRRGAAWRPRIGSSGARRAIVSSFVVIAHGPTKTSSSITRVRGDVDVASAARTRSPIDDVVVDGRPRGRRRSRRRRATRSRT